MSLQILSHTETIERALAFIIDFGPLWMAGIGFFILALAVIASFYDTWWTPRKARKSQTGTLSCQTPVRQPLARRETHQVSACQEQEAHGCPSHCL